MKARKIVIGVAAAIAVLLVAALVVGAVMWARAPYWMGRGMMGGFRQPFGGHMLGGGLLACVFGVLVLGGVAMMVSRLARRGGTPVHRDETPLDLLKRRYANGELSHEDFERIRDSLKS